MTKDFPEALDNAVTKSHYADIYIYHDIT